MEKLKFISLKKVILLKNIVNYGIIIHLAIFLFQIFCQVGGKMKGFFVEPNTGLVCIIKKAGLVSIYYSDLCSIYIEFTVNVFNNTCTEI